MSWRRFFLYAAVVVVVAFVGWQANAYYSGISSSVELVTLETEVGQQARTVLPDGSTVLLNACSKLTYSLGEWRKARGVQLEGEAIFDVKHKNGKPFYVHTRHYDIRVLGTNFNVSSYAEEAEDIVTLKMERWRLMWKVLSRMRCWYPGKVLSMTTAPELTR